MGDARNYVGMSEKKNRYTIINIHILYFSSKFCFKLPFNDYFYIITEDCRKLVPFVIIDLNNLSLVAILKHLQT